MTIAKSAAELVQLLGGTIRIQDAQRFAVAGRPGFLERLDAVVETAVFAEDAATRDAARWIIRAAALELGAVPSSIQPLYEAIGRGEGKGFTVPAFNLRGLTYDVARALFRAARKLEAGALICEIARSEIGYTFQRPSEYATCVMAAAIREGFKGPVFLQGDHFQVNAKKFSSDPDRELAEIHALIEEALEAGFLNIDIDSSTLVDLSKPNVIEQQRTNFQVCAEFTAAIRRKQPGGITVSVGGEIGEVGGKNSTAEELRAYMKGYRETLSRIDASARGISKISVQTGTTHGGIPLPAGGVAEVALDFRCLEDLSRAARLEFGLGGAVQHGASTLPAELFDRFPDVGTLEIHLATEFQNIIFDSPHFPPDLKSAIEDHLRKACADERKSGQTDEQFFYKTRKRAWGHFKRQIWSVPEETRRALGASLEEKFAQLMRTLRVANTSELLRKHTLSQAAQKLLPPMPKALQKAAAPVPRA